MHSHRTDALDSRLGGKDLADAVGDGLHLEGRAGHFLEHLLGPEPLPFGPELAQERSGFTAREPAGPELLP